MNKLRNFSIIFAVCLFLSSCGINYDSAGYPSNVYFSNEGGCRIIYGGSIFGSFEIWEGDSSYYDKVDSTYTEDGSGKHMSDRFYICSSDWLTVKHRLCTDSIVLYVKPNTTGKKRKARIDVRNCDEFFDITVKQDK